MPKKTKVALERELKEARKHLKDIIDCFTRGENTDDFNALKLDNDTTEGLDIALDEAREFLK